MNWFAQPPNVLLVLVSALIVNTGVLLILWWLQTSDIVRILVYLFGVTMGGLIAMAWDNRIGFMSGSIDLSIAISITLKAVFSWLGAGLLVLGLAFLRYRRLYFGSSSTLRG